jgi:glutaredoxin
MEYLMFTYPNCPKCERLKEYLSTQGIAYEEFDLTRKESKLRIREFLHVLKRDDTGGIILPTLIIKEEEGIQAVINSREDFERWSQSKD